MIRRFVLCAALVITLSGVCPALAETQAPAAYSGGTRIFVKDVPRLQKLGAEYPIARFWKSESMTEFRRPIETWWDEQASKIQKEVGLAAKPDFFSMFQGDLLLELPVMSVSIAEKKINDMCFYAVFDGGAGQNSLASSVLKFVLAKMKESETPGYERKDTSFMSVTFNTWKIKDTDTEGLAAPEDLHLRLGAFGGHYFIGVGTVKSMEKTLSGLIPALQKGKLSSVVQSSAKNDIAAEFDFRPLTGIMSQAIAAGQKEVENAASAGGAAMGPQAMLLGLDWMKLTAATGLLDLKALRLNLNFEDKGLSGEYGLDLTVAPRGVWKLLIADASKSAEPIPDWVPADAWSAMSLRLPLSGSYSVIMDFFQKELPMLAPLIQMQVAEMKDKQGVDLEKDILQLMDDNLFQVQLAPTPDKKSLDSKVFLLKLKNSGRFEQNLMKLMGMYPDVNLKPEEYMGSRIYNAGAKEGEKKESCFAFARNCLVMADLKDDLRQVLGLMNRAPQKNLAQSPVLSERMKAAPVDSQLLAFQNSDLMMKGVISLLKTQGSFMGQTIADKRGLSLPDNSIPINPKLLPEGDDIKVHFGTEFTYGLRTECGYVIRFASSYR